MQAAVKAKALYVTAVKRS